MKEPHDMKHLYTALLALLLCSISPLSYSLDKGKDTMVKLHTNHGTITLQLDAEKAPNTVKNFLEYVNSGFYSNTIFHRVIDGYMTLIRGLKRSNKRHIKLSCFRFNTPNGLKNDNY